MTRSLLEIATAPVRVREKVVEAQCDDVAARMGCSVVRFSQARATRQSLGISDRRYRLRGVAFWFEVKPPDGQLTREQHVFLESEAECGEVVGCGGTEELVALVTAIANAIPRIALVPFGLGQVHRWAAKGYRGERKRRGVASQRKQRPHAPASTPAHHGASPPAR